jgi:hypothetical protein
MQLKYGAFIVFVIVLALVGGVGFESISSMEVGNYLISVIIPVGGTVAGFLLGTVFGGKLYR